MERSIQRARDYCDVPQDSELEDRRPPLDIGQWAEDENEIIKMDVSWPGGIPEGGGGLSSSIALIGRKARPRARQFKPKIPR